MGKEWDGDSPAFSVAVWREVFRVLKPGGYLLAFGGCRTYHRMVCAVEDAGFIIHPMIAWVFGSGFPKATNLGKMLDKQAGAERKVIGRATSWNRPNSAEGHRVRLNASPGEYDVTLPATPAARQWNGWFYGLQSLKPAIEPICMAQKPPEGRMTDNILKWGTGAINAGACRVPTQPRTTHADGNKRTRNHGSTMNEGFSVGEYPAALARFPANLIHDGSPEVLECFPETTSGKPCGTRKATHHWGSKEAGTEVTGFGDSGSAARFFYCAKASKAERGSGNGHPTVKPLALMRYLVRLVTPPGGIVLDHFAGSGTTLLACEAEGFDSVGIELGAEHCETARRRLAAGPLFAQASCP